MTKSPEVKEAYTYLYLGRLGDFGLGTEGGIESKLITDEAIHEYAQKLTQCLVLNENPQKVGCIDGRRTLSFADGSAPEAIDTSAGATLSDTVMALGGESDLLKLIGSSNPLDVSDEIEAEIGKAVGTEGKCSHDCNCGACGKAIAHLRAAASAPVMTAVEAVMGIDQIQTVTEVKFDSVIGDQARLALDRTADWFDESGWDGAAYTRRATEISPQNVEQLAGDADLPHHGHVEQLFALVADSDAVISEAKMAELGLEDAFKATVGRIKRVANALAGQRGADGELQALITGFAWNFGVGNNLAAPNMPVIVIFKNVA